MDPTLIRLTRTVLRPFHCRQADNKMPSPWGCSRKTASKVLFPGPFCPSHQLLYRISHINPHLFPISLVAYVRVAIFDATSKLDGGLVVILDSGDSLPHLFMALIFDYDGVILESEHLHRQAYNNAAHFNVRCPNSPSSEPLNWSPEFYDELQNQIGGGKPKMRWLVFELGKFIFV